MKLLGVQLNEFGGYVQKDMSGKLLYMLELRVKQNALIVVIKKY